MANFTFGPGSFPAGSTASAFKKQEGTNQPVGSAVDSDTVGSDGSVTFTGLAPGTAYVAISVDGNAAQDGGPVYFYVDKEDLPSAVEELLANYGMGYVNHGADKTVARPTGFASITWRGSVTPDNMTADDVFIDTSGE